ncbi:MAG: tyramine oxidase, partial [Pseudomonadota bacterium]
MDGTANIAELHPLAPLTADEITETVALVRAGIERGEEARFEMIELAEPPKSAVRAYIPGAACERRAWANAYFIDRPGVTRCLVSLTEQKIVSDTYLPEAVPMIAPVEFLEVENAVKADPRFQEACRRRGIEDMDLVCCDPWSAGNFGIEEEKGRRISHVFVWVRNSEMDNQYAHPVEGLNASVDINTGEVLSVVDKGDVPIPRGEANYDHTFQEVVREDLRPINVVQPDGVSFRLDGNHLTWHDWSVRIG